MLPFTAVLPMDVQHQGAVTLRAEERVRSGSDIKTFQTEIDPVLKYDLAWRGGQDHFVLVYQPRLIHSVGVDRRLPPEDLVNRNTINLADPNETPFSVLHNGGLGLELLRERWRLTAYQFAAYGPISTTALLVQQPWSGEGPPPDPNPIIPATIGARLTLLFVQSQVFVPIRLTPRTSLTPGFTYNVFGGADAPSRGVIALTSGPYGSLELEHAATHSDRLITSVGAGEIQTRFQDDRDSVTIIRSQLTQTWRHYFSNHVSSDVLGGGTVGGDPINGYTFYTLGTAALTYDSWPIMRFAPGAPPYGEAEGSTHRLQLGLIAKVQPWIDLFSGDFEQRLVISAAANYTVERVTFRGGVSQARVVATPQSVAQYQILLGDAGLKVRITPQIWAEAGGIVAYQNFNNAVRFNELSQLTVYGALTYSPLPARW